MGWECRAALLLGLFLLVVMVVVVVCKTHCHVCIVGPGNWETQAWRTVPMVTRSCGPAWLAVGGWRSVIQEGMSFVVLSASICTIVASRSGLLQSS